MVVRISVPPRSINFSRLLAKSRIGRHGFAGSRNSMPLRLFFPYSQIVRPVLGEAIIAEAVGFNPA
jgi:hypothetical protein